MELQGSSLPPAGVCLRETLRLCEPTPDDAALASCVPRAHE